jgi:enoyl-CoA hydratase/carnithine racemase
MSGENIDGRRAYEIGLVDHLVMAEKFDEDKVAGPPIANAGARGFLAEGNVLTLRRQNATMLT